MEGILHWRFVRGDFADAQIHGVDSAKAETAPVVVVALTGADIPPERRMTGTLTKDIVRRVL